MSNSIPLCRFTLALRPTGAYLRGTGTCPDAGPVLKIQRTVGELNEQSKESQKLEKAISSKLEGVGYGG